LDPDSDAPEKPESVAFASENGGVDGEKIPP